ncbi:hypothetical protein [Acidithiobacillus ferridurans]|jgi:hypothetical protein|uniref:hypothetical protein n=1 Tax=Acidithiobacillus ferridurans TaxID=1232575 RepID=UPI001C06E234|nr:hypothetical protein [Acidithiobacillus ferridurans]MBU2734101.1 hypothetical protein [Acidithiobacillus ferridurans]
MKQAIETLTNANRLHMAALTALEAAQADRDTLIQQVATEGGDAADKRLGRADTAIAQASTAVELADSSRLTAQHAFYIAQVQDLARQRDTIIERHRAAGERITEARRRIDAIVAEAQTAISALHQAEGARNDTITAGQIHDANIERVCAENPTLASMHPSERPRCKLGAPLAYSQIDVTLGTGARGLFGSRK